MEIIRAHILDLMSEVPPSRTSPCTVMGHLGTSPHLCAALSTEPHIDIAS
ncbi:uncharacterized protein N7487_005157 [Penicillium crustosum]|nr:uncharacterized protein N7487_005157 [Penicillium crustosum]KAJ5410798.1 hypothetical protein N7487_005157 [Penicillium crustosum]